MSDNPFKEMAKMLGEEIKKGNVKFKDGNIVMGTEISEQKIGEVKQEITKAIENYLNMKDLADKILEIQPFHYDKYKIWWKWNLNEKKWEIVDETDVLNIVAIKSNLNTIKAKEKTEIIEALKQTARLRKPKEIKNTWVQFKDTIYDVKNDKKFKATPEYFVTNPIPYKMSETFETPTMDRIFEEWVGKKMVQTLYEIIAYSCLPDYPINRIFIFYGSGLNGKSKYLELLRNFVGDDNCCSTELDALLRSRFEVTRLHKKLICQMGETNFNEMNKTSLLKQLSGGDLIGFEYKNKNPFSDKNYAKLLISTNNLPTTTDKTIGFYRRFLIIDFPNRFSEKKDILAEIPKEEYNALATKSIILLNKLLKKREFHEEGTIEQRMERYEARSNFLEKFIELFVEEDVDGHITSADFYRKFVQWSEENKHRKLSEKSVGMAMKKLGYTNERKTFSWLYDGKGGQLRCWVGIKWKE